MTDNNNTNTTTTTNSNNTSPNINGRTILLKSPFKEIIDKTITIELNSFALSETKRVNHPILDISNRDSRTIRFFLGVIVSSKVVKDGETKTSAYFEKKDQISYLSEKLFARETPDTHSTTPSITTQSTTLNEKIHKIIKDNGFPIKIKADIPDIEIDDETQLTVKISVGVYRVYSDHQVSILEKFFGGQDNDLQSFADNVKTEDKEKIKQFMTLANSTLKKVPNSGVQIGLQVLQNVPAIISTIAAAGHVLTHNVELITQSITKLQYDHKNDGMRIVNPDLDTHVLDASDPNFIQLACIEKVTSFNKNRPGRKEFEAVPVLVYTVGNQPIDSIKFINPIKK